MGGGRWEKFLRLLPNRPPPGNRLFTLSIPCHFLSTHSHRDVLFSCPSQFGVYLFVYLFLFICFTGHEGDRWETEQRQLHERHQLARTQLKETFFLQRSQMLNRHQKVRVNIWHLLLKKKKPVITYYYDALVFNIMIKLLGTPLHSLQLWLKSGILLLLYHEISRTLAINFCKHYFFS